MATNDYKDGITATGVAGSSTIGPFTLLGGKYGFAVEDTGTADATLKMLMPDGSTYVAVGAAVTSNGYEAVDLPPGTYEITSGTGTSLTTSLVRIPYRAA